MVVVVVVKARRRAEMGSDRAIDGIAAIPPLLSLLSSPLLSRVASLSEPGLGLGLGPELGPGPRDNPGTGARTGPGPGPGVWGRVSRRLPVDDDKHDDDEDDDDEGGRDAVISGVDEDEDEGLDVIGCCCRMVLTKVISVAVVVNNATAETKT